MEEDGDGGVRAVLTPARRPRIAPGADLCPGRPGEALQSRPRSSRRRHFSCCFRRPRRTGATVQIERSGTTPRPRRLRSGCSAKKSQGLSVAERTYQERARAPPEAGVLSPD